MNISLAGIVPVAGQNLDFNMPWHDALMPIGPNYLMVERAVLECAYAGCKTIWIVCNDDMQPLIRHKLGESIQDPVYVNRSFSKHRSEHRRPIKIYYVPINAKDVNKRDCLSWSVIHGAQTARKVCSSLSTWLAPKKFYVAWPYGYYNPNVIRDKRDALKTGNVYLKSDYGGVSDGQYMGFSFDVDTLKQLKEEVRVKSTGFWRDADNKEKLPINERFSYRFFSLEDVFDTLDLSDYELIKIDDYYRIDNWVDYCMFLSENKDVKRPHDIIFSYREWNEIGYDAPE